MSGGEIALIGLTGSTVSKFLGPSTFVARHENNLRVEEQRIAELRKEYESWWREGDHLPPRLSFGCRPAISRAEENHQEYSRSIRTYKTVPFYNVFAKAYTARQEVRAAKRALQEAIASLASDMREARNFSNVLAHRDKHPPSSKATDGSEPNARLEHDGKMDDVRKWVGNYRDSPSSSARQRASGSTERILFQNRPKRVDSMMSQDRISSAEITEIDIYSVSGIIE